MANKEVRRPSDEAMWELSETTTRRGSSPSASDGRRPSGTESTTSQSADGTGALKGGESRRMRPSVSSASSKLATVSEMNEQRRAQTMPIIRPEAKATLTSEESVLSSQKVLTNFEKVAFQNPQKEHEHSKRVKKEQDKMWYQQRVYAQLKKWADLDSRSVGERLQAFYKEDFRRPSLPSMDDLVDLVKQQYPPRGLLTVHVCDFGVGYAKHHEITLGQVEEFWQSKPDNVDVRWIHAPLGLGLAHSSVEDIYLHDGAQGRAFTNATKGGWPYLDTEILNLRSRDGFQEMRDVYLLLKDLPGFDTKLEKHIWDGENNASLQSDIDWRANHLGTQASYWNLTASDMPWQMMEGMAMVGYGPTEGLKPIGREVERQSISKHPFYRGAQLVRNPFRTFHRDDGFLLTLSPMAGVNYLDKHLNRHMSEPPDTVFYNDDASAVGHVYQAFADQGSATWHRRTVEWFLIYLLTEVGCTPHTIRQGGNAPSIEAAYTTIIQDLKRRRYDKWVRGETVKLVRDYLTCVDELTSVKAIIQKKVEFFTRISVDVKRFEAEDMKAMLMPNNQNGETMNSRVDFALNIVKHQCDCYERLLIDLKQSMNALFQLRSIEQNELAIVSDSQNKAVLVFTGVTIVFLPLSFFTSYFGMNLAGIVNSELNERWFWRVCGTVALIIVLLVSLGAFRHRMKRMMAGFGRAKVGGSMV